MAFEEIISATLKYGNLRLHEGYYYISSRKEGNNGKSLHRLIWEDHYQKSIPKRYEIHHINGIKTDNRIQNLQCVEGRLHHKYHGTNMSKKWRDRIRECRTKKGIFKTTGASIRNDRNPENSKCWNSKIRYNGNRQHLGDFQDFLSAEIVYNFVKNEIFN